MDRKNARKINKTRDENDEKSIKTTRKIAKNARKINKKEEKFFLKKSKKMQEKKRKKCQKKSRTCTISNLPFQAPDNSAYWKTHHRACQFFALHR